MQTQTVPVQSVACPSYAPATGTQSQQSPQQQFALYLVNIARQLEQAIPAYQFMHSLATELLQGRAVEDANAVLQALQEAAFHHSASLGAIRRFLAGEATPGVLSTLALSVHFLARTHQLLRPLLERLVMAAAPDQRVQAGYLTQYLSAADQLLNQAGTALQPAVGPQIWQATGAQVFGSRAMPAPTATDTQP